MAAKISSTEQKGRRNLARNVRHLRAKNGMNQRDLAERAGLSQIDISTIERGMATARLYGPISEAVGVSLKVLTETVLDGAEPLPRRRRNGTGKRRKRSTKAARPATQAASNATFQVDNGITLTLGGAGTIYLDVSGVEVCLAGPEGKQVTIEVT